MSEFTRRFYSRESEQQKAIEALKNDDIFTACLKQDICEGKVFPALRPNNVIDFYCQGGVLFRYEGKKYKRNPAYNEDLRKKIKECVKDEDYKKNNIPLEEDKYQILFQTYIEKNKKITFIDSYNKFVEENRYRFSTKGTPGERQHITKLYPGFSPYVKGFEGMILLDVEIGFPVLDAYGRCNIDTLFLDLEAKIPTLYFIEVKDINDTRLAIEDTKLNYSYEALERDPYEWIDKNGVKRKSEEKIGYQIKKYKANIEMRNEIISEYVNYIDIMQSIFCDGNFSNRVDTLKIYPNPKLLVYGEYKDSDTERPRPTEQDYEECFHGIEKKLGSDLIKVDIKDLYNYEKITNKIRNK